jgi:hypothetical protein
LTRDDRRRSGDAVPLRRSGILKLLWIASMPEMLWRRANTGNGTGASSRWCMPRDPRRHRAAL